VKKATFFVGLAGAIALTTALLPAPTTRADRNYVEPCFYHDTAGADGKASALCAGLVDVWNFEEGSDNDRFGVFKTPLLEISGVNTPSIGGKLGNGLDLESSSQNTLVGFLNLGGAPYTLAVWYRLESMPPTSGRYTIASWDTDNIPGPHLYVEWVSSTTVKTCLSNKEIETGAAITLCTASFTPTVGGPGVGTFYSVAAGESPYFVGKSRLFISHNASTLTTSAAAYYTSPGIHILDVGTHRTKISGGTFQNLFDGTLDQLVLAKRAWSQKDVDLWHNANNGLAYPFDTET
jgi:hypothetical protein